MIAIKTNKGFIPSPMFFDEFNALKPGEYSIKITKPRNIKFHKKYFALLNFAFKNWDVDDESYKNFDCFRKNVIILAGYYIESYDFFGNIILEAQSISFSGMDEVDFEELYSKSVDVILKHVLKNYTKDDLENVVLNILGFV